MPGIAGPVACNGHGGFHLFPWDQPPVAPPAPRPSGNCIALELLCRPSLSAGRADRREISGRPNSGRARAREIGYQFHFLQNFACSPLTHHFELPFPPPPCLPRLPVGGISRSIKDEGLRDHFAQFGEVSDAFVVRDSTGRSRGCGFVKYKEQVTPWMRVF